MVRSGCVREGDLVPAFRLESGNRAGRVGPWDYKQRSGLVVLVLDAPSCACCRELLRTIVARYGEIRADEVEVLAVVAGGVEAARRLALDLDAPFPVLADESGAVRASYVDGGVGLFVVDRYNALFKGWAADDADGLPDVSELLEWLTFLAVQCEECHPPEPWGGE